MLVSDKDIETLVEMEKIDVIAVNAKKKLAALPQRKQISLLSSKRVEICEKLTKIEKMHEAESRSLTQIDDETEMLQNRRTETQKRIDESMGDYRAIESLSKDMSGMSKRLEKLDADRLQLDEKLAQIAALHKQIDAAIQSIDKNADALKASLSKESDTLMATIDESRAKHEKLAKKIPDELEKAYMTALRRCGGVALCELHENQCSACRSILPANRVLQVKKEAPLGECPQCHRLMIIH